MPLKANVSLLIFCLDDLSIVVSGVLNSPTIILLPSNSSFQCINLCFIYLRALMLGAYISFLTSLLEYNYFTMVC